MNSIRRLLALLLCAFLLAGALPAEVAPALAEAGEEIEGVVEVQTAPAPSEPAAEPEPSEAPAQPAEEPAPAAETLPAAEPSAPETSAAETPAAAPAAPAIDTTRAAAFSPDFVEGYAVALRDSRAYAGAAANADLAAELKKGAVVYVSARVTSSAADRLEANFSSEGRASATLWLDAESLRPLDEQEIADFVRSRSRDAEVTYYRGDRDRPLALVACAFLADAQATAEPIAGAPDEPAEAVVSAGDEAPVELPLLAAAEPVQEPAEQPEEAPSAAALTEPELAEEELRPSEPAALLEETLLPDASPAGTEPADAEPEAAEPDSTTAPRAGEGTATPPADEMPAEPVRMTLGVQALTLGIGETQALAPVFSDGESHAVRYASAQKAIASVSNTGVIKGLKAGSTTVTVTSEFGDTAAVRVTVQKAPTSIAVSPKTANLGVGDGGRLRVTLSKGAASALTFVSSDPAVASVDREGNVTALGRGTAVITVQTYNNKRASCTVVVSPAPDDITLSAATLMLGVGQSQTLKATLTEGSRGSYTFASSAPEVAAVNAASGAVTAVSPGTATITVTTMNGKTDTCAVTVCPAPTGIELSAQALTLGVGQVSAPVQATLLGEGEVCASLSYSSTKPKIASVNARGEIKGVAAGKAVIRVTTHNGKTASIAVTVKKAPASVKLSPASGTLGVGETGQLKCTLPKNTAAGLTLYGYDPEIISVSETGVVTALGEGRTKVTVRTHNKKTAVSTITVKAAPTAIALSDAEKTLGVGQSHVLRAQLNAESAGAYTFASSDESVAVVNALTGAVKAVGPGTAEIRVETYNHVSAVCALTVKPAPTCVVIRPGALTLGVKETAALEIQLGADGEDCEGSYTLKSSNAKIVKVGAGGAVQGLKAGTATVTATAHNGKKAAIKVTVKKAPTALTMTPAAVELGVGETSRLKWTLSTGAAGAVRLLDYDEAVIFVAADNTVTALAVGATRVTAQTYNGKKASCTVTVKAAPVSLELSRTEAVLGEGQSATLRARVNEGSAGACTFASSDEAVATVNPTTGAVKALRQGTAVITATTYNGVSAACTLTVKPAPARILVTPAALTIGVGETVGPLNVDVGEGLEPSYTLKSSNAKIASVSASGTIKGVKAGSATITFTTYNGKKTTVKVTVKKAPTAITLSPATALLGVGESGQLRWSLSSGAAGGVTFSGYDEAVLSVSASGEVTAVAPGTTTIVARTYNGRQAACAVTVKPAPTDVRLAPEELKLGAGESGMLQVLYSEDCAGSCTFASSDEEVARVNARTGVVTAVKAGEATVTVRTYNGLSAACTVKVSAAPTGVKFQEKSVTLAVGDSYQLREPVLEGPEGVTSRFTYASSNTKYLAVDGDGRLTALRAGTVRVKVATYNGKSDTIYVYVKAAPAEVWFAQSSVRLGPGETYTPEVRFTNGLECSYVLSISEAGAAALALEADGRTLRALDPGTAEVQVTAYNGKTARMTVQVLLPPESVTLSAHSATLGQRETLQLTAAMPENQGSALTYTSSNEAVATVDASGLVRGVAPGRATIAVRTTNDKTDACEVTVLAAPTRVTLSPEAAIFSLEEGSAQLTVGFGAAGEGGGYTLTSSNPGVATVSADGLVTFKGLGRTEITVKTYNNYTAVSTIQVAEAPGGIAFAAASAKVAKGDRICLPVRFTSGGGSYTLNVADPAVLAVEGEWVQGLKVGTTTLTATTYNGHTAACAVTVVAAPTKITLDWSELELTLGEEVRLTARTNAEDGLGSYTFASGDAAIASVDAETGLVTARGLGETTVTVTTYDGACTASCRVKVAGLPTYRALILGEYATTAVSDNLPFARNNVNGMAAAVRLSSRNGVRYGAVTAKVEQGKAKILSSIRTTFANAQPYDVSVIYIVAHGLNQYKGGGQYVLGTTAFSRSKSAADLITATELMAALNTVPGKVILILDSCYSGAFLDNFGGRVAANPNLAVLCSSHGNTRSCYWNVTGSNAVDFFTYALLEGLGYEERTQATLPLKADANSDGCVTVSEAAVYAAGKTVAYVRQFSGRAEFHGDATQVPAYSIGGMENVPFVAR